jgi:hypothetical protein
MEIEKRVHFISHYVGMLEPEEVDWLHRLICLNIDFDMPPCIKKTNSQTSRGGVEVVSVDEDLYAIKKTNIVHKLTLCQLATKDFSRPDHGVVHHLNKTDE